MVILQDAFSTFYTPEAVIALLRTARSLGFDARVAPYFPSGKSLHVKGFVRRFRRLAEANTRTIRKLATEGTLVGIDPAVTLIYRDEYARVLGEPLPVLMVQEWLASVLPERGPDANGDANRDDNPDGNPDGNRGGDRDSRGRSIRLLPHCTERTLAPRSPSQWQTAFERLGATCRVIDAGCCGMCGAYGHETEHAQTSEGIFRTSWAGRLAEPFAGETVVTGYSCRSQAARFAGVHLRHPVEVVAELAAAANTDNQEARREAR